VIGLRDGSDPSYIIARIIAWIISRFGRNTADPAAPGPSWPASGSRELQVLPDG
jgi:hypothetical protein